MDTHTHYHNLDSSKFSLKSSNSFPFDEEELKNNSDRARIRTNAGIQKH